MKTVAVLGLLLTVGGAVTLEMANLTFDNRDVATYDTIHVKTSRKGYNIPVYVEMINYHDTINLNSQFRSPPHPE